MRDKKAAVERISLLLQTRGLEIVHFVTEIAHKVDELEIISRERGKVQIFVPQIEQLRVLISELNHLKYAGLGVSEYEK